jgi:hypothetical protein
MMSRITHWVTLSPIRSWWHARQRAIDMEILWPECLAHAEGSLYLAKTAFAMHCHNDPAWQVLGREWINEFIDKLEAYD